MKAEEFDADIIEILYNRTDSKNYVDSNIELVLMAINETVLKLAKEK
tara:strand:+ start:690 stop:830 length:141 start_codon:yes stop_codon:yes gene_type:complete